MRPIKFRAYLKNENKIIDVKSIDWDENGNLISINYPEGKDYFGYENDDIVLMQYTGYKDVFGNEIYEDDVVKYRNSLYQVKWVFFSFYIHRIDGRRLKELEEIAIDEKGMKLISNIYENPELLEKNKVKGEKEEEE